MTDFPEAEYAARIEAAQRLMAKEGFSALFLASEAEIRYFTGFRTLFWQSPTRPWFLILPASGRPLAIIPEIGAELMRRGGVADIQTWSAPAPEDDGISLLQQALGSCAVIGMLMGHETHLRMPVADLDRLRQGVAAEWRDCTPLIRQLRMRKSDREIAIHRQICGIASDAFEALPATLAAGQPLAQVFRSFKQALLGFGAEDVPYLVGGAAAPSYGDVISPPDQRPLQDGDMLMLDTGATLNGYFCDFDRNFAIGQPGDAARRAYDALTRATDAGLQAARPGVTAAKLYQAMAAAMGIEQSDIGRFGHGLGMQLTEWPSLAAWDDTVLEENMVITLEPSIAVEGGGIMVSEENIVLRDGAPELLSRRASPELPVID